MLNLLLFTFILCAGKVRSYKAVAGTWNIIHSHISTTVCIQILIIQLSELRHCVENKIAQAEWRTVVD